MSDRPETIGPLGRRALADQRVIHAALRRFVLERWHEAAGRSFAEAGPERDAYCEALDKLSEEWGEACAEHPDVEAVREELRRGFPRDDASFAPVPPMRVCPLCKGKKRTVAVDAIEADGALANPRPADCIACDGSGVVPIEKEEPEPASGPRFGGRVRKIYEERAQGELFTPARDSPSPPRSTRTATS